MSSQGHTKNKKWDFSKSPTKEIQLAAEAFLDKVIRANRSDDECWVPANKPNAQGYVVISFRGRDAYLHRFAYWTVHGPIGKGMRVYAAVCRNRACGNPYHMGKQSAAEFGKRLSAEGRVSSGPKHSLATTAAARRLRGQYTDEQIAEIKSRLAQGQNSGEIRKHVPASKSLISLIRRGKARRDITQGVSVFSLGASVNG